MVRFTARMLGVAVLFTTAGLTASAGAQPNDARVTGRVTMSVTPDPVAGATVVLRWGERPVLQQAAGADASDLTTQTAQDGTFAFRGLKPGHYHVLVEAQGFLSRRLDVRAAADTTPIAVTLDLEIHFTEVLSVSATPKNQFDTYQATSVLAGQELAINVGTTLGASLNRQPGVAERAFGPGPARPVIRGFDGDRVLILEDGQRTGDLSSQSGDHGVNVNPASASRIEVVRGPAALLYGSSAIGGLVNVITDTVPAKPLDGVSGSLQGDAASGNRGGGGAADFDWGNGAVAIHAGGGGAKTGNMHTPEGEVDNTQSRNAFGAAGVSWTSANGYVGGSYGYDDMRYGIPIVEGGEVELTPRRHAFNVRGERRDLGGFFESVRGLYGYRRYRHDEIVSGEIGTRFKNDTNEIDLRATHRAVGRLSGTVGGWGLWRAFESVGEEALSPPVDQQGYALFAYEEVSWPHVTLQFGGRYDRASFQPAEQYPNRDFNEFSGSVGALFRPTGDTTVAVNIARAARHPALEELYFFGPHLGNFAFEIGNPDLSSEIGLGFDVSFRWRVPRVSGEVTYFRNDIDDFIYRNPITPEEFDARYGHDAHGDGGEGGHEEEDLPIVEFVGADSVLQGFEAHADIQVGSGFAVDVSLDYVRGELKADGTPLPRIPPFRFLVGPRYQHGGLQVGADVSFVADQDRVGTNETPTDGYGLLKLFGAYSFAAGGMTHTVTLRLDNATNELYRNHLSYIKDQVPEMGRSFKVVYGVNF